MPVLKRLESYLDEYKIPFVHSVHPLTFTAKETAHSEHINERKLAKTVVVLADDVFAMAVLSADSAVDLPELRHAMGVRDLRLATEEEMQDLFPDCDLGAMPPFGNLYGLPVYVESSLAHQRDITFNAGTHRDVVRVRFDDFERAANPVILAFGRRIAA
jgi:Ala-tRNA(Pro) deacylase